MSRLSNFIASQWSDVKGNAKWDFIKWAFWTCLLVPTGIAVLVEFIGQAPLWKTLVVLIAGYAIAFICLFILIWAILNFPKSDGQISQKIQREVLLKTKAERKRIEFKLGKERGKYMPKAESDRINVMLGQTINNYINEGEKIMRRVLDEEQAKLSLDEATRFALKEINRQASAKAADDFRSGLREKILEDKETDVFPQS
jgi:hypothetical protein